MECEDCGTTDEVMDTYCPYADDVDNEIVNVYLCVPCYDERAMDI